MSEKKKGFWSWLGFGKKETKNEETPVETAETEAVASVEEEYIQPTEGENSEQATAQQEENLAISSVETRIEETLASIKEFVEEKTEEVETFLEEVGEKIEQSFEEEKEESVQIREVEEDVALTVENELSQAVENSQDFTNLAVEAEEKTDYLSEPEPEPETEAEPEPEPVPEPEPEPEPESASFHQILEAKIEAVVDAELDEAVSDKSAAEENFEELNELVELEEEKLDAEAQQVFAQSTENYQEKPSEGGFFSRLLKGLVKTKQSIGSGFLSFFRGKKIDDDLFEELEEQLLVADLGMPTTTKIINNLTQHASKKQLKDADLLYQQLKVELAEVLKPVSQPLEIDSSKKPYVILMVGVNGVGKTTTIGKLARKFQQEGKSVMLAAGDTFRAAAVEQLQVWGERNHIPVVAQSTGSDSASVIFDAMQSAHAKGIDILIADTAGRLQNKNHLMDELKKIVRVMKKYDESAPHEIMLTLDAGTGQNAISQAKLFNEAVGLTGIALTKLDGTAKGGVIFAIADQFNLPIRYIGVGEKIEDLRPFNAEEFIEALFEHEA